MQQHLSNHWLRNFGEQIIIHMANTFDDAAIFIVDHNQTILYWSEGAEQILGFTAQEVEGQHCLKGIRCMQCMKGCGVQQYNNIDNVLLEMHTKDGHSFKVRKHAQALYDSSGNFAGAIEILRPETQPQKSLKNSLTTILPKRFIEILHESNAIPDCNINQLTHSQIEDLANYIHAWQIKPNGTEGYRTAEVTLGGVNTDELSSKTFEAKKSQGLYFIGEVTDVTGWLGGYNFQYAWSCGFAAGQYA